MAESLAMEAWRDGNWMRLLAKVDSCGYDQHGALLGEVFLNGTEKEQLEFNLPGIRERRWGLTRIPNLRRKASVTCVCRDGMVVKIGAYSSFDGLTQ